MEPIYKFELYDRVTYDFGFTLPHGQTTLEAVVVQFHISFININDNGTYKGVPFCVAVLSELNFIFDLENYTSDIDAVVEALAKNYNGSERANIWKELNNKFDKNSYRFVWSSGDDLNFLSRDNKDIEELVEQLNNELNGTQTS